MGRWGHKAVQHRCYAATYNSASFLLSPKEPDQTEFALLGWPRIQKHDDDRSYGALYKVSLFL